MSPQAFAHYLGQAIASLEPRFPRRTLPLNEASEVARWNQAQELRLMTQPGASLMGELDAPWRVAYADQLQGLEPSALNRTVLVVAVDDLAQVLPEIARSRVYLQTVGLAAAPAELFVLAEQLGQAGVTRICALGSMTSPEAGWHHDGRFNLLDLVQVVEIEQSAELAAEGFAPYVD